MKIKVITAHPRSDSLTMRVTKRFIDGASAAGHSCDQFDLYQEKFNPILYSEDEPDWENPNKIYSDEVMEEIEKVKASDALIFIFPVWWYSVPAIMKGYLDRVLNYGIAYGGDQGPVVDKMRWIGLVGLTEATYKKRNYHTMMEHHLNVGIANYMGVEDSKVHFIYNTLGETDENSRMDKGAFYDSILEKAYVIGENV